MAEPRLSKILIGAAFIGLVSFAFMLFLSGGAEEYNAVGYSNSSLEQFTQTSSNINDITNETRTKLQETGAGSNSAFDIFGSFFSSAWTALKTTYQSITTLTTLSSEAVDAIPSVDSSFRLQLKTFITSAIIIIITIAIFFHFIKASNRL